MCALAPMRKLSTCSQSVCSVTSLDRQWPPVTYRGNLDGYIRCQQLPAAASGASAAWLTRRWRRQPRSGSRPSSQLTAHSVAATAVVQLWAASNRRCRGYGKLCKQFRYQINEICYPRDCVAGSFGLLQPGNVETKEQKAPNACTYQHSTWLSGGRLRRIASSSPNQ